MGLEARMSSMPEMQCWRAYGVTSLTSDVEAVVGMQQLLLLRVLCQVEVRMQMNRKPQIGLVRETGDDARNGS